MGHTDSDIGRRVRAVRESQNLSQEGLAYLMREAGHRKWTQSTVWSVESGERSLKFAEALAVMHATGATLADLTGDAKPQNNMEAGIRRAIAILQENIPTN